MEPAAGGPAPAPGGKPESVVLFAYNEAKRKHYLILRQASRCDGWPTADVVVAVASAF